MPRFISIKKHSIGTSPDDLIFHGEQKIENVSLRIVDFDTNSLIEKEVKDIKDVLEYQDKKTVTWLNIDGLHNAEIMNQISEGFGLDKMILSDVLDISARPKVIEYDNCIFISLKMLQQNEADDILEVENLSLIMTGSVLITFQEQEGDVFEPVRKRIRNQRRRIRSSGTDYLTYALLDIVIDNYIHITSVLGEKIESLEDKLLDHYVQDSIEQISIYKRELNFLRRTIKPAKEMILSFSKLESDLISNDTYLFLKELRDNINQASDVSDSYREILSDQLNVYHTTISSRLNDIMKFLTIFSVVFIPLTFIAGIYGTNFDILPELHYKYSYFIMLGVMFVIAVCMMYYFKKKKWY